jgi:UDP-GlcNAc:undecaprenyl-phosphate GlcNAc-1-phosphate transferase
MLDFINTLFYNYFNFINLYILIILISISFYLTIFFWPKLTLSSFAKKYEGLQRVHQGEISRLGGALIYICIFLFFFFSPFTSEWMKFFLLSLIPMIIVILIEDIYHNLDFRVRLLSLIISVAFILFFCIDNFPSIDNLPFIPIFFDSPTFNFIFYGLCLLILANGFNFIDGMNGLLAFYSLGVCISCLTLCWIVNDLDLARMIIIISIAILIFLFFNYPLGKIFLGDTGAYLLGLFFGSWIIYFFAKHEEVSSWNAVLILAYPTLEVLVSVIRKCWIGRSPFYPDRGHLHLKIYDLLVRSTNKSRLSNNLVVIFLSFMWLSPPLMLLWVYENNFLILLSFFLILISYISLMVFIPHRDSYKLLK